MSFSRTALGIDISQEGIKMALLTRKRDTMSLEAFGLGTLPTGSVKFSLKEPNVHDEEAFVREVREIHLKLLTRQVRASVSLPDSIGRVMLVDLETRFKNKEEGANLVRWKLKKSFPFDINDAHLDYQILKEKETGEISTLVSLISRSVLHQYEDLLGRAGLQPNRIDFTTFNLYSLFSPRLDLADNAALLICNGDVVSILIFYGGVLTFYRSKEIPGGMREVNRVFREVNSSLLVYSDKYPAHTITEVFCITSASDMEAFSSVVAEAMGQEPVLLDAGRIVTIKEGLSLGKSQFYSLTAALGAGMRNF